MAFCFAAARSCFILIESMDKVLCSGTLACFLMFALAYSAPAGLLWRIMVVPVPAFAVVGRVRLPLLDMLALYFERS